MRQSRKFILMGVAGTALLLGISHVGAQALPTDPPPLSPNVNYKISNWAYSPPLTKFVDTLPGLGPTAANNLGQYIPVAAADTTSFPGSAYYEVALVDYTQQLHSELPPTKLRGYVQVETPAALAANGGVTAHYPLPNGMFGLDRPRYLGPVIVATKGTPTRIKFYNLLPAGAAGDLFIPVDTTVMGAGMGPDGATLYSKNRATLHLHGGDNPWISDGTAHQWITPAGETGYTNGVSQRNVPDMPAPEAGACTFFWPNGLSGRLMFYHDHAFGITRLNVYAGEAAGYLLVDPTERALNTYAPGGEIPLIVQDKGFVSDGVVPAAFPAGAIASPATAVNDPLWADQVLNPNNWGQTRGSLWLPHVYMPNQNPNDPAGANPLGRLDYGAWFWPIFPSGIPPTTSIMPEAFMDTPLINGTAYPHLNVNPTTYRFRILNACNDRYVNLQFYVATSIIGSIKVTAGGTGYTLPPMVTLINAPGDTTGRGATAVATIDTLVGSPTFGQVVAIDLMTVGSGYTAAPSVFITPALGDTTGTGAAATANVYSAPTEVGMVPASKNAGISFPAWWQANDTPGMIPNILDGRQGGVPDPAYMGPSFIHIGTEGGLSPNATELQITPMGYEQNKRSVTVLNTFEHTVFLGPAERADVMVDFSQFAGKTLIVYNDAPAPLPAGDPRYDFYTGNPDNTFQGGAPSTQPGFGPNTRTMMRIKVAPLAVTPGPIASLTLTGGGTNYSATPLVTISDTAPSTGSGATASATVSSGSVRAILLVAPRFGGAAYLAPVVTIGAPDLAGGVQATATAITDVFGDITAVTITNPGSGYSVPPTVTITGTGVPFVDYWPATAVATLVPGGTITGLTLLTPGAGYTAPVVTITDVSGSNATATATIVAGPAPAALNVALLDQAVTNAFALTQPAPIVPAGTFSTIQATSLTFGGKTIPMQPKTIQELFDPLGRMNATLGVELPFTTATIQTTIPYGFADPATEVFTDGVTQLWKITHNGVDTHAIHFHLFNVQVINRVGWDGAIKPPWPEELGWKETVKMNPLEDIVVALTAKTPTLPASIGVLPNNVRTLDPTMATNSLGGNFLGVDANGNPVTVSNVVANFGNEYTWHCHLLGHEENDMMRPIMVAVPPAPPTGLAFTVKSGKAVLTWVDTSADETAFLIQKKIGTGAWVTIGTVPAGITTFTDTAYKANQAVQYQVIAINTVGSGVPGYPSATAFSPASAAAAAPLGITTLNGTQALPVGSPVILTWTYSAADQTGFTVLRSTVDTFAANQTVTLGTVAGTVRTFTDTSVVVGLRRLTPFYYRVIPFNANGSGLNSNTKTMDVHP